MNCCSFVSLSTLAGVHVALRLLQAREDLFEQRLVLGGVLTQPLVHLLHLPADPLQSLGGGGSLRWCGRAGGGPRCRRPRGDHAVLLNGRVPGDRP